MAAMGEELKRSPTGWGIGVIILVVVSGLVFAGFFLHRQSQAYVVAEVYEGLEGRASDVLAAVEEGRMDADEGLNQLVSTWWLVQGDEIDAEEADANLPGILLWTGTTRLRNDPELRERMTSEVEAALRTLTGGDEMFVEWLNSIPSGSR